MSLPSISGHIVVANDSIPGDVYRYTSYSKTKNIYIKKKVLKKINPLDKSVLIQLGGVFQEIGGDNENAGGGYQKLG